MGLCIFLLLTFSFLTSGCDKYTQYKALTFFFTGVPHPDERDELALMDDQQSVRRDKAQRGKKDQSTVKVYMHGPFAANQCFLCHETEATVAIGKSRVNKKKSGATSKRFERTLPGRLVAPLREICIECHVTKSMKSAYSRDLWIHGPVSAGTCTICHSPHSSRHRFMLLYGSSSEMCTRCHGKGFITETEYHLKDEECTNCHNAHLGKDRFLLKKDFDEIY